MKREREEFEQGESDGESVLISEKSEPVATEAETEEDTPIPESMKTPSRKRQKTEKEEGENDEPQGLLNRIIGYFTPTPSRRARTQKMGAEEEEEEQQIIGKATRRLDFGAEEEKGKSTVGQIEMEKEPREAEQARDIEIVAVAEKPSPATPTTEVVSSSVEQQEEVEEKVTQANVASTTETSKVTDKESDSTSLLMDIMNVRWLYIRNDLHGALDSAINTWRRFDTVTLSQPEIEQQLKNIVYYDMNEIVHEIIERKEGVKGISEGNRGIAEALVYFEKKSTSVAIKQLRKIISSKDEQSKHLMSLVHYLLAQCLTVGKGVKDMGKVKKNIQRAIELDPQPMYLYYNVRGTCHLSAKDYKTAIEDYTRAIDLLSASTKMIGLESTHKEKEFDIELFYNRAEAYFMLGDLEQAEKDLDVAQMVDKNDQETQELMKKVRNAKSKKSRTSQ